MSLTREQIKAVEAQGSVAVIAGAGTGKTHMLAERYLYHLTHHNFSPLQIVAVTFTDKAADELRARIRRSAQERIGERTDILAKLEAAQISTIHALAMRICREHYEKAGVPPDFHIHNEFEGIIWNAERIQEALEILPSSTYDRIPFTRLRDAITSLLGDPIPAGYAFEKKPGEWPKLVDEFRNIALVQFINHPIWQNAKHTLTAVAGNGNDKMEICRRDVVYTIVEVERRKNLETAIQNLCDINLRGGSKKNWSEEEFKTVKSVLKELRELVRETVRAGLITLQWGAIDEELAEQLPLLRQAFQTVRDFVDQAKRNARLLDYADLEVGALRALNDPAVRSHYTQRWKAFLVDEFQDTNPVQAELLEHLTRDTILTIVGDQKQSIYGFRRADVEVFQRFYDRIRNQSGNEVTLDVSFRTHARFMSLINDLFSPILESHYQNLESFRIEEPHPGPHIRVFAIQEDKDILKPARLQMEAHLIARQVQAMIADNTLVYDKKTDSLRPIRAGDIAILSRTWQPLDNYAETLEAYEIPTALAGGGNLLETQTAKDAWSMLRFLADPRDDLALAAVLRGPWFAVSDRVLFKLAQDHPQRSCWWEIMQNNSIPELTRPFEILKKLQEIGRYESPSRLLLQADHDTGYSAILANLPGSMRREADWRGFIDFIRELERGGHDVFYVTRQMKRMADAEIPAPRPPLEAGNAVALMTVHAAKGLEWPIVIVPDLARTNPQTIPSILFDPEIGMAMKWNDENGETQKPALFKILEQRQKERETAESKRLLYVAFTRARDHLILTSTHETGGSFDRILPGLQNAGIDVEIIPFDEKSARPPAPPKPAPPADLPILHLQHMGSGLSELPATGLTEYAQCPKRFYYHFIDGHPGVGEKASPARRIGRLTHCALEHGIRDTEDLRQFDPAAPDDEIGEAVRLANAFDRSDVYASVRQAKGRERPVMLRIGKLMINGIVDLYSRDFVLDYKTDQQVMPEHHRFQLFVYAQAMKVNIAHIAYLRHDRLHTFEENELNCCKNEAIALIERILNEDYQATPSPERCMGCPFQEICKDCDF
ncbi:MAG: DNA helicase UvrD [Candidatus Omnitrophota bacterium]|jgi:ATP-dependent helicase/nuclease subunit A|nr:MAG: DNA helicase UvrD [Candidatus Omnitrophota bacterium]